MSPSMWRAVLCAWEPIDDVDFLGSQPHGTACHIDGDITAADDGHLLAHLTFAGQINLTQKIDALTHTVGLLTGHTQFDALVGTNGKINRLVVLAQKIVDRQVRLPRGYWS